VIARVVVAGLAVVVIAWLGVIVRDRHVQQRGVATTKARAPGYVARADSDFRSARFLNADSTPDLARAVLYQGAGQPARSAALAQSIVKSEPENLTAWGQLLIVSRGRDPGTFRRSLATILRLDPLAFRKQP
jgi:hypothetical protein